MSRKIAEIILPRDIAEALATANGHGNTGDLAGLITLGAHLTVSGYRPRKMGGDISDGVAVPIRVDHASLIRGAAQLTPQNPDLSELGQGALASAHVLLELIQSQIETPEYKTALVVPLNNNFLVRFTPGRVPVVFRID